MSVMLLLAQAGESSGPFRLELPPLHPILVNFTAALVPASLVSDVLGRLLRRQSLLSAGWWMLFYAALITPFTALAGWMWLRQMAGMNMPAMPIHKWLGTALAVVFVALVIWRWRIHRRPDGMPGGRYLSCAAVVVAALIVQGNLGGSMSFEPAGPSEPEQPSHSWPELPTTQERDHQHAAMQDHQHPAAPQWRDHIDVP